MVFSHEKILVHERISTKNYHLLEKEYMTEFGSCIWRAYFPFKNPFQFDQVIF